VNDAVKVLRGLVADETGRRWGDRAADWQVEDAEAILSTDPAAPRLHFLTRPRGGSKTSDSAGVALAAMLTQLGPRSRCYAAAADEAQACRLIDAGHGLALRTPGLAPALLLDRSVITVKRTGTTLEALPADRAGTYGLLPALVIVDELANWASTGGPKEFWVALLSAMVKVPGSRLVVLTSAGDPAHWSARVREVAAESPRWRLAETPGPLPWVREEALEEQRRLLLPSQYARLHLNVWSSPEDRLTTRDDLVACAVLDGPQDPEPGRGYVIGVDLGFRADATVAAVAHLEPWPSPRWTPRGQPERTVGRVALDRMELWQGSAMRTVQLDEVERWLLAAAATYNRAEIVIDPFQAIGLAQRLRARGLTVQEFTFSQTSTGHLASVLYRQIADRALMIPYDPELLDELAHVRLRETSPGVMRMDHDAGRHDDRAVALALAAQRLLTQPDRLARALPVIDRRLSGRATARSSDRERRADRQMLLEFAQRGDPTAQQVLAQESRRGVRFRPRWRR